MNLLGRPEWQRRAACRSEGTELFVRGRDGGTYAKAKDLCAICAVRLECLEMAPADDELVGLWGGTTGSGEASDEGEQGSGVGPRSIPERSAPSRPLMKSARQPLRPCRPNCAGTFRP